MNKDWLSLSLVYTGILLSACSYASSKDGFYFGAGVGTVHDRFELTTSNPERGFITQSPTQNVNQTLGNLFAGLGFTLPHNFFLGGEVGTYFPSRSATVYNRPGVTLTGTRFTDEMKVKDEITVDLLPGYRLNDSWLLYGRLGGSRANIWIHQYPAGGSSDFVNEDKKWGGRIGAGITYSINSHLGLSADYFYTRYPTLNSVTPLNTHFAEKISNNYAGISAHYTI